MSDTLDTRETPAQAARRLAAPAIAAGFVPAALHRYCNAAGDVQFWRLRAKHPNGEKWIRPMRWNGRAFEIGEPPAPAGGKLLYGLANLHDLDDGEPVIVVEGEICVDRLVQTGLIAVTSGSADSADAADWSPLRGRHVLCWGDHDAAGRRYVETVTAKLRGIAASVDWIDVVALSLSEKGDCVDWLAMHPDADAEAVWALARIPPSARDPSPERSPRAPVATAVRIDDSPRVILRRGSEVAPVAVDWLWPGWLAGGKLHLIGGAPGTGKTTLAAGLAAIVTCGGRWPDGTRARAGSVVIWSGEDDNADTLNPRLRAAGADMQRVHVIERVIDRGEAYPFDPARDMDALSDALQAIPDVRLIVVDPVVSAVSGDSHKNAEVRRGLQPLVDLAASIGGALLGVTHFSKGTTGRDPLERITGSLAFGALARIVLVAAKQDADDDRPARRVLLRAKSNNGPDGGGFAYDLQQAPLPDFPGIEASCVVWGEAIDGTARDVLAETEVDHDAAGRDAAGFLRELLLSGERAAKDVFAEAGAAGYSRDAMHRAKRKIGAVAVKQGMLGGWVWRLSDGSGRRAEGGEGREDGGNSCSQSSSSARHLGDAGGEVIEL
jgi:putative DNA primase/helicase